MKTSEKGKIGENLAAEFLEKNGFVVVERNYRARTGEIDLIAEKSDELSFVEMKSWNSPGIAIDSRKRKRILQTSKIYLKKAGYNKYSYIHYDIIFIDRSTDNRVDYLKNAFTETNS